mmetsp:Transcript_3178/g.6442  ORF Transcript_3178/g.6442 Transcript_3178/m.6442 type:complete len:301 (-) Transcript_3178:77-979(-)
MMVQCITHRERERGRAPVLPTPIPGPYEPSVLLPANPYVLQHNPSVGSSVALERAIQNWNDAIMATERYRKLLQFEETICHNDLKVGSRPDFHPRGVVGTVCEPWLNRDIVSVLKRLLRPHMRVLEWSSGSSTITFLANVHSVLSVEHCKAWMAQVNATVNDKFMSKLPIDMRPGWTAVVRECEGCDGRCDIKHGDNLTEYVNYPVTHHTPQGKPFDFVSVDGRWRVRCFERVLDSLKTSDPLVNPCGGLIMLDNAERPWYSTLNTKIPPHWKVLNYTNSFGATTIWMVLPPEGSSACLS